MHFEVTPDQLELVEAVRRYLEETHTPEVLRRLDRGANRDPEIWNGLVGLGLPALLVPREHGGLGMTLLDAALIARECGRVCLAEPLVETALVAVPWLVAAGRTDDLEAIAEGRVRTPPAHVVNQWVADGEGEAIESIDPLRNLSRGSQAMTDDPLLLDLGALLAAAQLLGLGEAMLAQAVAYAKVREQFGQPIGGFQAVKHQLANVAVALEFARPVVWRAAQALGDGLATAPLHVSHAKIAASDAAYLAGETAIQVHGAMGYTYEVDLHFWMKRSWALAGAWGARALHQRRVDAAIVGGAHAIGPRHTFS